MRNGRAHILLPALRRSIVARLDPSVFRAMEERSPRVPLHSLPSCCAFLLNAPSPALHPNVSFLRPQDA